MVRSLLRGAALACGLALIVAGMSVPAFAVPPPPSGGAPEIDAGSLASAAALVAGGVALMADRFRRKK